MPGADLALTGEQGAHEFSRISADFSAHRIAHFGQFRRIDFDHDFVRSRRESLRVEAGDDAIETSADGEQKIAILDREVGASGRDGTGAAREKPMIVPDEVDG